MRLERDSYEALGMSIANTFAAPAIGMVAWGAFLHMVHVSSLYGHSLFVGYWGWFMLNLIIMMFWTYIPSKWHLKEGKNGQSIQR